jgi:lipoprotein NlpI
MQPYYNRGIVKFKTHDINGALDDFNKSIELQSDYADAYLNRGLIKLVLGKNESACNDLNKASTLGSIKAVEVIKKYCK